MDKSNLKKSQSELSERREYIRLNVVFPVEFQFIDLETGGSVSDIKQGFTRDIGKGGICLEVNNIEKDFEEFLENKNLGLDLRLHIPLSHIESKAISKVAWYKKIKSGYPNKYFIGLSFVQIDPQDKKRIYFHARRVSLTPKIVAVTSLCLILGFLYFYSSNFKLTAENRKLINQLVTLSGKKALLESEILQFDKELAEIERGILENQEVIGEYRVKVKELDGLKEELTRKAILLHALEKDKIETKRKLKEALSERTKFRRKVAILTEETEYLKNRISRLSEDRGQAKDTLDTILSTFEGLEEKSFASLYRWLERHQNSQTGLVISYEGDRDLEDWAFTYDQSLASQCFLLKGDQDNAKMILDFYKHKARKVEGAFANAYDARTGKVVEYTLHAGPNIWLGIAVVKYTDKTNDFSYLSLAEDIAKWLLQLQNQDSEFGIRGGPHFAWYSTEHNLDAYAFFGMLYEVTENEDYLIAQRNSLGWIRKRAFNRPEGRLNRGKGDATIATDTFAWAVAALGPELLNKLDMNPDQILDFAETNCLVTAGYIRPSGEKIEVTGFDFGKYLHLARGGIVSTEWTAQMIVTFKIMADYYKDRSEFKKASYYKNKSDFYLSELEKMVIISPSRIGRGEWCLPYASQDNVDTGHGWRIAKGTRTGSTAGTIYTIFAKYSYNPLMLD